MSDDSNRALSSGPAPMEMDPNAPEGKVQTAGVVEPTSGLISDEAWATAVAHWIDNYVRNSPVAGFPEAWNHLHSVLPKLRAELETELNK